MTFILSKSHQHVLALTVAAGVQQQLLHDRKHHRLQLWWEFVDGNVVVELDFRTVAGLNVGNHTINGRRNAGRDWLRRPSCWLTNWMRATAFSLIFISCSNIPKPIRHRKCPPNKNLNEQQSRTLRSHQHCLVSSDPACPPTVPQEAAARQSCFLANRISSRSTRTLIDALIANDTRSWNTLATLTITSSPITISSPTLRDRTNMAHLQV